VVGRNNIWKFYSLVSGTTYAIVVRSDNGGSTLRWSSDNSSPTYSDGFYSYSSDGSSWTGSAAADMMFEIWGTVPTNHEAAGLISGTGGIIVEAIVNSNHEVAGSISGIGSITGDTNNNWKIEGSIAGTSTPAGEAVVDWLAGGEIAGTGLITGLFFIESYLWAKSRSSSYDKTKVYDEATQTWITADSRGGSRFRNQLIVMAKQDDGNAKLYYSGV